MIKILLAIVIIIIVSNSKKKTPQDTQPSMPEQLKKIRYVRVDYINWRTGNEGTLEYDGTVSWEAGANCWEIFIDNCTFADSMIEKSNIIFLDENKNVVSLQGFSFTTEDVIEGDCGRVKIY